QLFEDVFDSDHAGGRAKLVHHDRQMTSAIFKFGEQFGQNLGFGDDQHVVHDLADLHARNTSRGGLPEIAESEAHPAHEVFVVQHTDNVFGTALRIIDRDARVLPLDNASQSLVEQQVGGQRKNIRARDHNLADGDAVEFDGAVDHFFLELGNLAELPAGGHDELQFIWGVNGASTTRGLRAKDAQNQATGTAHEEQDR